MTTVKNTYKAEPVKNAKGQTIGWRYLYWDARAKEWRRL